MKAIDDYLRKLAPHVAEREAAQLLRTANARLDVLEREHTEFFDRWHEERRKYEELRRAVEVVRPVNWHEDSDWVQLTETFSMTPNAEATCIAPAQETAK